MSDLLRPTAEVALAAWADRVRANHEQVERVREQADEPDRYAPLVGMFRADPRREDEAALTVLRSLVQPTDVWLDIGAGGGRYALPLALLAREVIALDQSEGMLATLREGMASHGIANVRVVQSKWPSAEPLRADVALISHVGYDIAAIGPFLDAMEAAASRLCVAVLLQRQPTWLVDQLWPTVHGQPRATLPTLPEFLVLQLARGRLFELRLVQREPQSFESREQALAFARLQTWVRPDGERDRRLQALVRERLSERNGRFAFGWEPVPLGIVTWQPKG
jgi:SAM-dependent methyltransferase